ncbi:RNA polymerase sigma factor [Emticicia sp. BO119]|uniref:RNA polymerase sigma factor n=1 Tax=Emticicia sp. BO119 TaxID=2757768 RepID=UPI0015F0A677|nr:sigma-70 family RNA polymerase sigma factor [Emticicia sp. BO119]MBA4853015.1 sigma-70 family RNA polymerase sigma factor [Emticicia sp. BO119]
MLLESEIFFVNRLKNREEKAFAELYDKYYSALYGILLKIVNDTEEAENLMQDSFVKIWKNIDSYDAEKGRLFTWMLNIARNTALNHLRSVKNIEYVEIQNSETSVYSTWISVSPKEPEEFFIKDQIAKMDFALRQVIDMIYYWGYTQQETAEKLNLPLGTVKTRTRTALSYLRDKLGNWD